MLQVLALLQARLQNPEHHPGPKSQVFPWRQQKARRSRSLCGTELRGHREFIAVPPAPGQPLHLLQPLQLNHCPGLGRKKSPVTLEEQGHSKGGGTPSVCSAKPLLHPAPEQGLRGSAPALCEHNFTRERQLTLKGQELESTREAADVARQG